MTTSDDGRGGSVPPRPPAGKPQQWFVLRPWVFDVTLAGVLLRATPRPPVPIPVAPQEDAEPWPGGSARPVLAYLTGTLGVTSAGARELLKAARTAQAEAGPGALADYPVPGGDTAFAIFNDHPRDGAGADLAYAYYERRLRSLSFPETSHVAAGRVAFAAVSGWPRLSSRLRARHNRW